MFNCLFYNIMAAQPIMMLFFYIKIEISELSSYISFFSILFVAFLIIALVSDLLDFHFN